MQLKKIDIVRASLGGISWICPPGEKRKYSVRQ